MGDFFSTVLTTSARGSIVIFAVLLFRLVLKRAPKKYICLLWMLAGIRLLLPVPIESVYSLQPQQMQIVLTEALTTVCTAIWLALAASIGIYSVCSYIHLRRMVLDAVKIPGGWESDRIETAFVLGFVKPKIYIPTGMPDGARQQILAHERTHLDKGDHWIKMIGFLALAVHWFNPLVWLSYILLCKDIEMACDERVVRFMELNERKTYSAALLRCSTNRAHYAACPVAFGEISVKYRIKSILNYRKPVFWISLLAIAAFAFVGICLMTNPQTVVEVPVDADASLRDISQEDPADFVPAQLPETEPNPDWGLNVILDVTAPTGGTMVYVVEERFAAASGFMEMKDAFLERWNGTAWEPVTGKSSQIKLLEIYSIGFAQHREEKVNYHETELDWTLDYGALPAGDYRLCQTIKSATDSAQFRTPFHVYREKLPAEEEAALLRCEEAMDALLAKSAYSVLLSETAPNGEIYPVKQITKGGDQWRVDYYAGEFCVSSNNSENAVHDSTGWSLPFGLNQNRQFLFPEGTSVISQDEVTFSSVWTDHKGMVHHGLDTFRFFQDGTLSSVDRQIQKLDEAGNTIDTYEYRMEEQSLGTYGDHNIYISSAGSYMVQDSGDAQEKSPWGIFFRVDDDLLEPVGGEVWLSVDAVGVSNYTTDGSYWLEKKMGTSWKRLGNENTAASWGKETITLTGQTKSCRISWADVYGELEAGVYRMGKRFYNGTESIIQYAEFAIYQTGGVFGEGGEAALARLNTALERLQTGNYRLEKYSTGYSSYDESSHMTVVIWKYGTTMVQDYYNNVENYSHSSVQEPGDILYGTWLEQIRFSDAYDAVYFCEGYRVISDREIRFVHAYSRNAADNPCTLFTCRFDDAGNLTEIEIESMDRIWDGHVTRYIVTDTPESEIQAWVEAKKAEQQQ